MNWEGPGIYQHYKGGHYRALGVARHESSGAKEVVYHSYSIEHDMGRWMDGVDFVARPLNEEDGADAWNTEVRIFDERGSAFDQMIPRFSKCK